MAEGEDSILRGPPVTVFENQSGPIGQQQGMSTVDEDAVARSAIEPAEFGEIFDRYFSAIHAYLTRRLGRTRADDLTGEVFRVAFDARTRYDPAKGGVRPWLYGIANNVVRQHLRDGERAERAWTRLPITAAADDYDQLDDQLDARLQTAILQQALDRLLPADREALILFAVEELTYAEVAAVMDTPIGTVRSRISRARSQLREHLQPPNCEIPQHEGATHDG